MTDYERIRREGFRYYDAGDSKSEMKKPFDVSAAAKTLKNRNDRENDELSKRRIKAQEMGRAAARLIGDTDRTLHKVIGFGSTYESWRNYSFDSDIDLGIIGGDIGAITKILPRADIEISLIELDLQPDKFRKLVLKNGVILYEK